MQRVDLGEQALRIASMSTHDAPVTSRISNARKTSLSDARGR
jgi:hypothetical protein